MDNWKFDPDNGNVVLYRRQAVKQMDTNNFHVVETEMKSNGGYRIRTFYTDEENGKKLESSKMQQFLSRGRNLKDPEAKVMPMKKITNDFPKKTKKGKNLRDSGIVQIQTDINKITQKPITTETTTPMVTTVKAKVTTETTTPVTTKIPEKITTEKVEIKTTIATTTPVTTKIPEKSTSEKVEIKTTKKVEAPSTTIATTTVTTIPEKSTTEKVEIKTTTIATTTPEKSTTEKVEIKTTTKIEAPLTTIATTTMKATEPTTVAATTKKTETTIEKTETPKKMEVTVMVEPITTVKAHISTTETTSEIPKPVTEKSTTTTKLVEETKVPVIPTTSTTVKTSEEYFPEMPGDLKIPVSVVYTEIKRTTVVPVESSSSSADVTKATTRPPRGSQKFENTV